MGFTARATSLPTDVEQILNPQLSHLKRRGTVAAEPHRATRRLQCDDAVRASHGPRMWKQLHKLLSLLIFKASLSARCGPDRASVKDRGVNPSGFSGRESFTTTQPYRCSKSGQAICEQMGMAGFQ